MWCVTPHKTVRMRLVPVSVYNVFPHDAFEKFGHAEYQRIGTSAQEPQGAHYGGFSGELGSAKSWARYVSLRRGSTHVIRSSCFQ